MVEFLEDNGGDPRNVGEDYIEAYVPVTLLGELSEQPGVTRVQEIIPPEPAYGEYVSQGIEQHRSQPWNQAGYSGQGVKVGVIDLGFYRLREMMGTELPTNVQGMCYTDLGEFSNDLSDCDVVDEVPEGYPSQCVEAFQSRAPENAVHGTAVSEAVIDIAPGASLYVANPVSRGDMQDVVAWMASEGVEVINYSAGWTFDGPGDGTSPRSDSPLNTVDQAVANDILFVTSAGNAATDTWFGGYSDPDDDGILSFDGKEIIDFPITECRTSSFQLRWEDDWAGADTDLDLFLYNKAEESVILSLSSINEQSGESGHNPFERIALLAFADSDDLGIIVAHLDGPVPEWVQILYWGPGEIDPHTIRGSIGNPAESANPGMLAVGAAHYWDTHQVTSYSSQGPTPDGRVKPDIVGTDCAEAASYDVIVSDRFDNNPCWFPGTSQASPHVAGMAALVRQRFPEYSAEETARFLKDYAEERGEFGADNTWGYGFAVLPPVPGGLDGCSEAITGDGAYPGTWAPGCQSAVSDRGYAQYYTFEVTEQSQVTIDLTSSVDTYLYLREGDATSGTAQHEDDDGGDGTNSRITATLAAGTYTVEATTYNAGETGAFTLIISGLGASAPGTGECEQALPAGGTATGTWADGCDSQARDGRYARYYTFNVADESEVTFTLTSEDADTYLNLWSGSSRTGTPVAFDDDSPDTSRSEIRTSLQPGSYAIEATTYGPGETGSFTLTVEGIDGTTAPTTGECEQELPASGTATGTWAAGCESSVSARGHARYYTLTLEEQSPVTIDLTSSVDTYLYLRSGDATSGDALHEDDDGGDGTNSRITATLSAGSYTIEATTYSAGATGNFTLTVAGLDGTGTPTTGDCLQELPESGSATGTWAAGCESSVSARGHARYYTFNVGQQSEVTITLESTDVDPYLYLRQGEAQSGTVLHENDDHDGSLRVSQIAATLSVGTYTIEATTYSAGQTGSFTLTVAGLDGTGTPVTGCDQTITADGTVDGTWAAGCDSSVSARGHARYYTFTLEQSSEVTIILRSDDIDPYLYLRQGEAQSGTVLHENDDHDGSLRVSQIAATLSAGTYTIEATTYSAEQTGSFTLTVSTSTGTTEGGATNPTLLQYAADHAGGPGAIYVGDISQLAGPAPDSNPTLADGDGMVSLEDLQNHLWLYQSSYYRDLLDRANLTDPTPLTSSGPDIEIEYACINRSLPACILVEDWLAPNLEARTGGRLTLQVASFPELGVAGPDTLQQVSDGSLEIAEIHGGYVGGEVPLLELQSLPGLYPDHETMLSSVADTLPAMRQAIEGASQGGVTINSNWYSGFDSYVFASKTLRNVADFSGLKTRSFSSAVSDWIEGMGAQAQFFAVAEVYIALERDIIDTAISSAHLGHGQRWFEVTDYMSGPLISFYSAQNVVNRDVWGNIPTDLQQIILEEGARTELEAMRLASVQNVEWARRLVDEGMEVENFSPEVRDRSFEVALVQHVIPGWLERMRYPNSGEENVRAFNQHVGPYVGLRIEGDGSVATG